MDKIDYKKTCKELYAPGYEPSLIKVPAMNFIMVNGCGNPNEEDGEYPKAVALLYALSYTVKMGSKSGSFGTGKDIFPDYVVPPLEGLWWMRDENDFDFTKKERFCWISMIRLPEFITEEIFQQAKQEVKKKKLDLDLDKARFEMFEEGLCVHCMHSGPYDSEPATVAKIGRYIIDNGLVNDFEGNIFSPSGRKHHEIYLSDPRKVKPEAMRTILRHPVRYK
jgi:hypothetical protein